MSDKGNNIGLSKITESIKRFERNIEQYKKSVYFETNTQINFIFKKLEELVNEDIKKYLYHMFEKKRIYVLPRRVYENKSDMNELSEIVGFRKNK